MESLKAFPGHTWPNIRKELLRSLEVLRHVLVILTEGRNLLLTAGYTTKSSPFGQNDIKIGLFTIPSRLKLASLVTDSLKKMAK